MRYIIPKGSVINEFYGKARRLHDRREVSGMQISVENSAGSTRRWYDPHGKESGSTRMLYDYGYIRGTKGTDGDHVDVYVGPNPESTNVYIITQMKKPDFDRVDEQKVMLGFDSGAKAKKAYLAHYNDPRFFGSMKKMNIEVFKAKVFNKKRHGELVRSNMLTLADLVKAAAPSHPPGAGWTSIPDGHKGGFRKRKGAGWEYWYPDKQHGTATPIPDLKEKQKLGPTAEEDYASGNFDKDPTHWAWKKTGGDLKPWVTGGIDPQSKAPVKVGGRFGKLFQIEIAEDPSNPGYAILRDVNDGTKMMMGHDRIYPVERSTTKARLGPAPEAPKKPAWQPPGREVPKASSGLAGASAKRAPTFEASMASKEKQPGLYAIENGVYPMAHVERWEASEDGTKKKVKLEMIGVPDHGKNLLIKEFEPLIASMSKNVARKFGLKSQFEQNRGRSTNITLAELQRAGIEGMLDAIERYDGKSAFAPHAKQFVQDHIRLAAARERLGGVSLPPRHQRNLGRYIAARAQASKALGVEDPSPEQVLPYFRLLKRHLHSHLVGKQAGESVPDEGYKILTTHEGAEGAVKRTGERVGESEPRVERDTVTHPGKLEWASLYDSFLKGQSSANELFDEDKFALPGIGMGLGYSPEERVSIRQSVQRALDGLSEFEFSTTGRKKITYRGDAGEMLSLRLGLHGGDEESVKQIAEKVPVFSNGKRLGRRQAEAVVAEMLEHAIEHARESTLNRDAKKLMERAEEKLVPPTVTIPSGPTWHEVVRKRAASVTPQQIAAYREEEHARLGGLVLRQQERVEQAKGSNKTVQENTLRGAEEALRRVSSMDENEIRMKLAQRLAPETAEMRRLMTQTITVDMPAPRGHEYGQLTVTMTDLATGAQRNVRVRTLRDLRSAEDRAMEKSERREVDATLTSGMVQEAINYPRTMRLLVAPIEQVASAPTIARRTVELLSGLGG